MVILAIDTSHRVGSVTIRLDARTSETREFGEVSHLVELGEAVSELAGRHGIAVRDLDRVAVVSGPGSFTGLRIGMAYAKGLHAAVGVDLVTITSLELLAAEALQTEETVCAMIDARRAEVYGAIYTRGAAYPGTATVFQPVCEQPPRAASPDVFLLSAKKRPVVFVGSGAERWRETINAAMGMSARIAENPVVPSTALLSTLAASLPVVESSRVPALEPFYIRPSDAKLRPLKRVRTHE
jgi:tRNA threonylcarbamoyladenosine biosynthesis protein TsaB